ncbi:MAG: DUF1538 domain-containing protein [Xanthomonadales bacterium]|nr:DUF1538 domain-containing protein [Gammaproteobacteria bacterium]MBT8053986.1 DUF1538 domain-containing protein [Gammaproteobacteria bacterium]NND58327.1 DUF1538 domain-containing protein [Xanthomonadales bacterium]NNK51962.1 DUF1538 domain-containing protein [Xanthomonadales bacterium]
MEALIHFVATTTGLLGDVLPIAVILIGFQVIVLRRPLVNPARVFTGLVFVLLGLALFLEGLELALFPLGRMMASQLTSPSFVLGGDAAVLLEFTWTDYFWVYIFAGAIGFATTVAEPALIAVSMKANQVSGGTITVNGLRFAVAVGVAFGVALGTFRIVTGTPLHWFIISGYVIVIIQTLFAPRSIIPLAYDSGGVTTSTVTVPLVAALGLGLAETIPGRSPLLDGFGLIAFASLFPMISVMAYAQISEWRTRRGRNADTNPQNPT